MKAEAAPPSYAWDNTKCLKQYDITLIIDDSGSMGPQDNDSPGTVSLWTLAKTAVGDLVTAVAEHNPQGVQIMFLNSKHSKTSVKLCAQTAAEVTKLFDEIEPNGVTPIGKKLQGILPYQHWWSTKEPKRKKLYLVATDGRPFLAFILTADPTMVKKAITRAATGYWKRSESHTTNCAVCANHSVRKIGIQFVQIGDDREATEYLVGLDDDLELPIDIVDTTTASPEDGHLGGHLVKALVGAVIGYYDREETAG
ncbi:hypothetical protein B0H13DRAFT_2530303 [Mycena leptocephala]|nr:hypothetical protein B0H13DRAFT_2530303 [Mycena leptocephala]